MGQKEIQLDGIIFTFMRDNYPEIYDCLCCVIGWVYGLNDKHPKEIGELTQIIADNLTDPTSADWPRINPLIVNGAQNQGVDSGFGFADHSPFMQEFWGIARQVNIMLRLPPRTTSKDLDGEMLEVWKQAWKDVVRLKFGNKRS